MGTFSTGQRALLGLLAMLLTLAALPAAAETFRVGGINFQVPADWRLALPTNPMRRAELTIPAAAGGEPGLVTFFHFGAGRGGTPEANIERWEQQFEEPKLALNPTRETTRIGGRTVHFFRAAGTFRSGMPGGPTTPLPEHTLLGAVIENDQDGHVFIRLVAPNALADAAAPAYRRMVEDALKG